MRSLPGVKKNNIGLSFRQLSGRAHFGHLNLGIHLSSFADPDPGFAAFLTSGSGIRNRFFLDPGSRITNPYFIEFSENLLDKKFFEHHGESQISTTLPKNLSWLTTEKFIPKRYTRPNKKHGLYNTDPKLEKGVALNSKVGFR